MDYGGFREALRDAMASFAVGGMVGAFVLAVELYDADGEPQLHTVRSDTGNAWAHMGMIRALQIDTETPFRHRYEEDE
jgi:hypothetical protein